MLSILVWIPCRRSEAYFSRNILSSSFYHWSYKSLLCLRNYVQQSFEGPRIHIVIHFMIENFESNIQWNECACLFAYLMLAQLNIYVWTLTFHLIFIHIMYIFCEMLSRVVLNDGIHRTEQWVEERMPGTLNVIIRRARERAHRFYYGSCIIINTYRRITFNIIITSRWALIVFAPRNSINTPKYRHSQKIHTQKSEAKIYFLLHSVCGSIVMFA